jgi:hypothetical protein
VQGRLGGVDPRAAYALALAPAQLTPISVEILHALCASIHAVPQLVALRPRPATELTLQDAIERNVIGTHDDAWVSR